MQNLQKKLQFMRIKINCCWKMLKVKGKVVAVMHTFPLKPDGKEALSTLKGVLENDGLLISPIGLSQRSERWHQALRNRVLATLSSCLVLLEEKDGGPSWKVFDEAEPGTGRFISKALMDDDTLAFPKARREKGARIYRSFSDFAPCKCIANLPCNS